MATLHTMVTHNHKHIALKPANRRHTLTPLKYLVKSVNDIQNLPSLTFVSSFSSAFRAGVQRADLSVTHLSHTPHTLTHSLPLQSPFHSKSPHGLRS